MIQGEFDNVDSDSGDSDNLDDWEDWDAPELETDHRTYTSSYMNGNAKNFGGKYGPFFPSFAAAALSVYLRTSKTRRRDFSTLLRLLRHPDFRLKDIPSSYKQCRTYLGRLPTLPIRVRDLRLNEKDSLATTPVYSYSVKDILLRALRTPSVASQMYFGVGRKVMKSKEFWHGEIWRESPLFGESMVHLKGRQIQTQQLLLIFSPQPILHLTIHLLQGKVSRLVIL